jgi:prepilin-type N-terminal cleavage/methylation domain-containing protein/prepilin-type processing-associated H-X9-DG protein
MRRGRRGGFTFLELMVVLIIVALAVPFVIMLLSAGVGTVRERANRIKCRSNLSCIGQAIALYANDNKGAYPRTRHRAGAAATKFTGAGSAKPFGDEGPADNDVTAALWLLVRNCDVNPEVFICPSSKQEKDARAQSPDQLSNFSDAGVLSYSYAHPYPDAAGVEKGYKLDTKLNAGFVVMADRNECEDRYANVNATTVTTAAIMRMNSRNHEGEGQNVLFADGHVEWVTSPFVGVERDHIYTRHGSSGGNPMEQWPEDGVDTILLPVFP